MVLAAEVAMVLGADSPPAVVEAASEATAVSDSGEEVDAAVAGGMLSMAGRPVTPS